MEVAYFACLHTWDSPCAVAPTGGAKNKRALIVGVSYRGTSSELRGTINDAHSIQRLLVKYFGFEKIMLLTDDHNDRMRLPTKRNILRGFEWLMRDLQDGESLFFYFAGHGGQQRDRAGVEPSGYNQTICPCDYAEEGAILDTQIHKALVKPLPRSVTLQALIDSCHSGTVMNLPWNAELERGKLRRWSEEYKGEHWKRTTAGGLVVQFSAARHDQTAAERATGGTADVQGAATYSFVNAIKRHAQVWGFGIVYGELLALMHDELRGSSRFCGQEPTLSASTSFDCMDERWKFTL